MLLIAMKMLEGRDGGDAAEDGGAEDAKARARARAQTKQKSKPLVKPKPKPKL